jgi:alpha-tubulin suppressor-like RCC1 family protein
LKRERFDPSVGTMTRVVTLLVVAAVSCGLFLTIDDASASVLPRISVGGGNACVLLSKGSIDCWGSNGDGQLGNGTTTDRPTPAAVKGLALATSVSTGNGSTCALVSGAVDCWGAWVTGNSEPPVAVQGITTAQAISASDEVGCALIAGGTIDCWGVNNDGQLGTGSDTPYSSPAPLPVTGISTATSISTGQLGSCAVLADGTVTCWGLVSNGVSGPVAVQGITGAIAVSDGTLEDCALLARGTVKCWGDNTYGQLGNGTTTNSSTPVPVKGISKAKAISAGNTACAVLAGGSVRCWGDNADGALGNGTLKNSSTPVTVKGIRSASAIDTGDTSDACALLAGGVVKCWGNEMYGALGNGKTTASSLTPVAVKGFGAPQHHA